MCGARARTYLWHVCIHVRLEDNFWCSSGAPHLIFMDLLLGCLYVGMTEVQKRALGRLELELGSCEVSDLCAGNQT